MEKPEPESSGWLSVKAGAVSPVPEAPADVEDAFETTDAFWAARRSESSRVSRFT